MSGAVIRLPLDIRGLAPSTTNRSVRSMSGTGMASGSPNISPLDTCLGIWSTVLAEAMLRVRSAFSSGFG